jgi:hypothetical protein
MVKTQILDLIPFFSIQFVLPMFYPIKKKGLTFL